jgi:hypothetical protein
MNSSLNLLKNARFPMYRDKIIDHVQSLQMITQQLLILYII